MSVINLCLWICGLVLQAGLLFLLFRRGLVRKLPALSILIAFYLVRAGALYTLFSHIEQDSYVLLYQALSAADLCLQLLVVAEIVIHNLRYSNLGEPGHRLRAAGWLSGGVVLAIILTALVPAKGREPIDRGALLITFLMIFSFLWMALDHIAGNHRRMVEGFAMYGIVATATGFGRNIADLHHNRLAYSACSYIQTGMYLCVVVFWMISFRVADSRSPLPDSSLSSGQRSIITR